MLISFDKLKKRKIAAQDGEVGKLRDLFFDDISWTVRYLVVDTGDWLSGRSVLLSPASVRDDLDDEGDIPVRLTREQVEKSPDMGENPPVSRQQEQELLEYYGLPRYWGSAGLATGRAIGMSYTPQVLDTRGTQAPSIRDLEDVPRPTGDHHLRSALEVDGYAIEAADGDIGKAVDFLVDGETWEIRYVIVRTGNWLTGRKVLLAPEWIATVIWGDAKLRTDLSRAAIADAPEYDEDRAVDRAYEERLFEHYERPGYWRRK